uniref:Uncharacterized protein n=1 Tax=Anguilla anguilla TaxID=7936 RepID=A0A0E9XGM8_ANGAN
MFFQSKNTIISPIFISSASTIIKRPHIKSCSATTYTRTKEQHGWTWNKQQKKLPPATTDTRLLQKKHCTVILPFWKRKRVTVFEGCYIT